MKHPYIGVRGTFGTFVYTIQFISFLSRFGTYVYHRFYQHRVVRVGKNRENPNPFSPAVINENNRRHFLVIIINVRFIVNNDQPEYVFNQKVLIG